MLDLMIADRVCELPGPGAPLHLVRSRFAGFSKIDPFHGLKVG